MMLYIIYLPKEELFIYTFQIYSQSQTEVINIKQSYIFSNFRNTY